MSLKMQIIQHVLSTSRATGLSRLRNLKLGELIDRVSLGSKTVDCPERLAPFLIAVYMGFDQEELSVLARELEFHISWILPELAHIPLINKACFVKDNPDDDRRNQFDHINFLQSMVAAFYASQEDSADAATEIGRWMRQSPAFMVAGLIIDSPHTLPLPTMTDGTDDLSPETAWEIYGKGVKQASMSTEVLMDMTHLPEEKLDIFLRRSGGMESDLIRGRFGQGHYWLAFLLCSFCEPHRDAQDFFFRNYEPKDIMRKNQILLSLNACCMPDSMSFLDSTELYESFYKNAKGTAFESIFREDAFVAQLITPIAKHRSFSLLDNEQIDRVYKYHDLQRKTLHGFIREPSSIYERVMASQMRFIPEGLPLNQFLVWGALGKMEKAAQKIKPEIASQYFIYVLREFQSFKFAPQGLIADLDSIYDDINTSMRSLMPLLEPHLNLYEMHKLSIQEQEDLALWGINVKHLSMDREAVMLKRLELDIGL